MPLNEQLSRWSDRHRKDWERGWDLLVDRGHMSEATRELNLARADEIGAFLYQLAEGQAVVTYQQSEQREPSPMIRLPRAVGSDA